MKLNVPLDLTVGDSIYWDCSLPDYPSDSYTLSWTFYNGQSNLNLIADAATSEVSSEGQPHQEAVPNNSVYRTTITSVQSTGLVPGTYYWQAYITEIASGDRLTLGSGSINVVADLSTATEFEGRSTAKKMLEAVQFAIQAILDGGAVQSYSIKGRSLSRMSMEELIKLRSQLRIEVAREEAGEKIAQGLGDPRRIFVRFR